MAGFATYDKGSGVPGTTMYADNFDFTGVTRTNTVTTNGQLPIGSTAANAGGNHINVGNIVSPAGTLSIGYSSPNITIDVGAGFNDLHTAKWIVNPVANAGGNSSTIQSAINQAVSGETIAIFPGTYTENLTLKAGVNLTAWGCDGSLNATGHVIIKGTCTLTTAGTVTISGIQLETNSAALLAVTGTLASVVNLTNCYLNMTNTTGITFSSSSASSAININNCRGDLGTTGIAIFTHTAGGALLFEFCDFRNSGASTTASTASSGSLTFINSFFGSVFTTSSTNAFTARNSSIEVSGINTTPLTLGGSAVQSWLGGVLNAGSASAVSASTATAAVYNTLIASSNTNKFTGAGTINMSGNCFNTATAVMNPTTATYGAVGRTGTWVPDLQVAGSSTGITYTTQSGSYAVIGNICFFSMIITLSNNGAGVGSVTISNLPVAALNTNQAFAVQWSNITITGNTLIALQTSAASTQGNFTLSPITGAAALLQNSNLTTTSQFKMTGFYFIA